MAHKEYRITEVCGFQAVQEIMNVLKSFYSESDNQIGNSPIRYIFRGVTREFDKPFIKSGSSVRLSEYRKGYRYADYINYNKNLVTDARKNFPDDYAKLSDLDVLADIQHKGGATCLVDFSKNILMALWFACSGDYDKEGVLYCYETISDIVGRNNLSVLTMKDSEKPIERLLVETRKCANFRGKYSHKFWMWYPSCINDRIVRQDSVFIFGLEKFDINRHGIRKIIIEPKAKKDILFVLAHCFNISAVTIYHDVDGYADSNAKLKDFIANDRNGNSNAYTDGFDNMLIGNYEIALDFFMQSETRDGGTEIDKKTLIEISYSKAVCYKHLGDKENAIMKYRQTYEFCEDFLSNECNEDTKYYYIKSLKAYNDELFLLYSLFLYDECLERCDKIMHLIKEYNTCQKNSDNFDLTYCKIAKIELFLLKILREENKNIEEHIETYFAMLNIENLKQDFYSILLFYFEQFGEIYFEQGEVNLSEFIEEVERRLANIEHNVVFSEWNFCDINEAIQELINFSNENFQKKEAEKFMKLKFLTSKMEDIQNIVHNNYLKNTSEY